MKFVLHYICMTSNITVEKFDVKVETKLGCIKVCVRCTTVDMQGLYIIIKLEYLCDTLYFSISSCMFYVQFVNNHEFSFSTFQNVV